MSSRDRILAAVKGNQPEPRELPPDYNGSPANAASSSIGPASSNGPATSTIGPAASSIGPAAATIGPASSNGPATSTIGPAASSIGPAAATIGPAASADLTPRFIHVLEAIGGAAYLVSGYGRIATILHEQFPGAKRIVTGCPQLAAFAATASSGDPHAFETVDLAILPAHFGVAENGACWITESQMIERALPFITQNLALVIPRQSILADMHQAYARIAELEPALGAPGQPAPAQPSYGFATFIAGPSKTADIEQSLVLGAHGPRSLTVFLVDEQLSDAGFY